MHRPRRFDLIAFDWDGTLFDSTALIVRCIQAACRDIGAEVPSQTKAAYVIGLGLQDALAHAVPGLPPARYPELGQRYRHHYKASQQGLSLFEGTLEMLHELKARQHLIAVATGKTRLGLDEALSHTELRGLFDASRTADQTSSKPHPQMLLELMAELGVPPERTLMVGDTTHDLQMAVHAGVASLGVAYGAHEPEALWALQPLAVLDSAAEMRAWLSSHA
jgi:phosphoglycolate phosphatase